MIMLTPGKIDEVIGVIGHPFRPMEGESFARALCRFILKRTAYTEIDWTASAPSALQSSQASKLENLGCFRVLETFDRFSLGNC